MVHLAWHLATLSVLTALPTALAKPPSGGPPSGGPPSEFQQALDPTDGEGDDEDGYEVDVPRKYVPPPKMKTHHPMKIPLTYEQFREHINLDRNGGKFVFAKFYIPNPKDLSLTAHFHRLSQIFHDSPDLDLLSIDCTHVPEICEKVGISTLPYLLYWDHDSDENGTMYEGYHTIQDMKNFIEEELGAQIRSCDFHHKTMCSPRERGYLQDWEKRLEVHVADNHLHEVERELKRLDKALKVKLTIHERHVLQWEVSMCVRLKKHIQGKLSKDEL